MLITRHPGGNQGMAAPPCSPGLTAPLSLLKATKAWGLPRLVKATPVNCKLGGLSGALPFLLLSIANAGGANGSIRPLGNAAKTSAVFGSAVKRGSGTGAWGKGGTGSLYEVFDLSVRGLLMQPAMAATQNNAANGSERFSFSFGNCRHLI